MKWLFIALPIILLMFIISSNELSSNSFLNNEQSDSYKACIKLKRKAPYFNLKCEHLLNNPLTPEKARKKETKNISFKTLSLAELSTRKVNKIEEIKLRKLMLSLSNENKLRED